MKASPWLTALAVFVPLLAGCGGSADKPIAATSQDAEVKVQTNLAKLSPEDRKAAEAQKFCAVMTKHRLGSMGTPVKVMLEGQPVFLCCDSCEQKAVADPAKTLAKVQELKAKSAEPSTK